MHAFDAQHHAVRVAWAVGLVLSLSPIADLAEGAIRRVPSEYPTIQSAIDASTRGDEVLVAPGTYADRSTRTLSGSATLGTITAAIFLPPGIAVRTEAGAAQTTVDGGGGTVWGAVLFGRRIINPDSPSERSVPTGEPIGPGPASVAILEGFTIVNTSTSVHAEAIDFGVRGNVLQGSIWVDGGTTGVFEDNALQSGGVFCRSRTEAGLTWRGNIHGPSAGAVVCRCRRALWAESEFWNANREINLLASETDDVLSAADNTFYGALLDIVGGKPVVTGNTFEGGGQEAAIWASNAQGGVITSNSVANYYYGILAGGSGGIEVSYNVIRDCAFGAAVGWRCFFHHNQVYDATLDGIHESGSGVTRIEDNLIQGSALNGMWLFGGNSIVKRNVVSASGAHGIIAVAAIVEDNIVAWNLGDGMHLGFPPSVDRPNGYSGFSVEARRNTVVGNSGKGLEVREAPTLVVEANIVALNGGEGVFCLYDIPVTIECNDVFANTDGDFGGFCADRAGVDGNISLDPLFCDYTSGNLNVSRLSPCAPENSNGCGLIGALSPGLCATADNALGKADRVTAARTEQLTWGQVKAIFRR